MFRDLTYMGFSEKERTYTYRLTDSEFVHDISVSINSEVSSHTPGPWRTALLLVVLEYIKKSNTPSQDIAKLYHTLVTSPSYYFSVDNMELDKAVIDKFFPDIKYGSKYYKCAVRHFQRLGVRRGRR